MPKVKSVKPSGRQSAPKISKELRSASVEDEEELDSMVDIQSDAEGMETDDGSINDDEDGEMDEDVVLVEQGVEEDLVEDEEEEDLPEAGPSKPKPSAKHRNLYAPPTLDELDTLSSTSSASFTLLLSALLSSTLLPTSPHSSLKTLLTTLHSTINSITRVEPLAPKEGLKKVGVPSTVSPTEFVPKKVNWTVGYERPVEVFVSGSWSVAGGYKTGKGEQGGVDMVLVMPEVRALQQR
jgi:U3 small nucleolar RNA-associated protein 22